MTSADHVFVIAEAGVNHNGSLERALAMVDAAAQAGADAVKFQTFTAQRLVSRHAQKAGYQEANTGEAGSQLEMLRHLELPEAAYHVLAKHCEQRGIAFMSTAFDVEGLRFLAGLGIPAVKIASGDVTAAPLILEAARLGKPLIVSTGMCTLPEIEEALGVLAFGLTNPSDRPSRPAFVATLRSTKGQAALAERVTLLHCVTEYPAPLAEVNLRAMDVLRARFNLPVGYSDHTLGVSVALAATALGATVLEKHFTLDRNLPGPDHLASLEPVDLTRLIREVREIELALGVARKAPSPAELSNRPVARRSLVAACAIRRGEKFDETNLVIKRPGYGRAPMDYWELLGAPATRDYSEDEVIDP